MSIRDWFTRPRITLRLEEKAITPADGPEKEGEMAITFSEFCKKYQGEKNAQGVYYTPATINAETGMDLGTLEKWAKFYVDTIGEFYKKESRLPNDDDIIAKWEEVNKPPVHAGTVPGTSMYEGLGAGKDLVIRMTKNELYSAITEIVDSLLAAHLGK